jgi:hypothetical protein
MKPRRPGLESGGFEGPQQKQPRSEAVRKPVIVLSPILFVLFIVA